MSNKEKYYAGLVKRVFRILPMLEEKDQTVERYLDSLTIEMLGLADLLDEDADQKSKLITIASTLRYIQIHHAELDHAVYKREIFKCIRLVKEL